MQWCIATCSVVRCSGVLYGVVLYYDMQWFTATCNVVRCSGILRGTVL